jgi:hypothetical protein
VSKKAGYADVSKKACLPAASFVLRALGFVPPAARGWQTTGAESR